MPYDSPEKEPQSNKKLHPLERRAAEMRAAEAAAHAAVEAAKVAGEATPQQPTQPQRTTDFAPSPPLVTYALIAINVAVFVIRALSPEIDLRLLMDGANDGNLILRHAEYWRLLTSMFLHLGVYDFRGALDFQGVMHIFFNMYAVYIIGTQLEGFFGHMRYAIIYLLGGLGGSLMSAVFTDGRSVGASGAVFAIIGAEIIFLYRNRTLLGASGRAWMRQLLIWGAITFAVGILTSVGSGGVQIDNFGHLGGLIGGVALAWFITPAYVAQGLAEQPGIRHIEDTNLFSGRYWVVTAYVAAYLGLLFLAVSRA